MADAICCKRRLQPTPPTTSSSLDSTNAIARSVISTSMANMCSCTLKQRSRVKFLKSSCVQAPVDNISFCRSISCSHRVNSPLSEQSIPFTTKGSGIMRAPGKRAVSSMERPGDGLFGSPSRRASLSSTFPAAISRVSPSTA
ncbi:peptidase M28, putative [Babesia ovata]|uniref:Peptidase M28, putative n=1 Tax=Babesia ovata TaxID=189622 RepID=A0A2H6KF86_9APIC|nr:peptidase M28, putative [Babesia ovata]GBE61644.1 peptidase M28, putative [Babesia ovata]